MILCTVFLIICMFLTKHAKYNAQNSTIFFIVLLFTYYFIIEMWLNTRRFFQEYLKSVIVAIAKWQRIAVVGKLLILGIRIWQIHKCGMRARHKSQRTLLGRHRLGYNYHYIYIILCSTMVATY